jgi:hypothetical protein
VQELLDHHRVVRSDRKVATLFGESNSEPDGSNLRLSSHDYLAKLREEAPDKDGWPGNDNAVDQLLVGSQAGGGGQAREEVMCRISFPMRGEVQDRGI